MLDQKAKIKYNEIISQENPEYKAVQEKVSSILKGVPTFEAQADSLAGLDAATLRAKLIDLSNGSNNETKALEAAAKDKAFLASLISFPAQQDLELLEDV